jgi:hypothetical protein
MFNLKRIPNEPAEAYSALSRYLGLGPKRSLKALSAELEMPLPKLRRWSRAFNWAHRAEVYDLAVVEEEFRLQHEQLKLRAVDWALRQEQWREEEWQTASKAMKRLREELDNPRIPHSFRDIVTMLDAASTLARRAIGSDWTDVSPQKQLFHLDIESALRRAYGEETENTVPRHN